MENNADEEQSTVYSNLTGKPAAPSEKDAGAYGWLVVAACTVGQFLTANYMGSGIFYMTFLEHFEKPSWETALVGSICVGFTFGAGRFKTRTAHFRIAIQLPFGPICFVQ